MMKDGLEIQFRKSNGNLHLGLKGNFSGESARKLLNFIDDRHDGQGLVFVDTHSLGEITPEGSRTFVTLFLASRNMSPSRLIFKGNKGFQLAPEGARVLVLPGGWCGNRSGGCGNGVCRAGSISERKSLASSTQA